MKCPDLSFQFFKKNIKDYCAKLKHTHTHIHKIKAPIFKKYPQQKGMLRKGRGKTRDSSTDVKGRKHVKNKNTQVVQNSSDVVAASTRTTLPWIHITVGPGVKRRGRKRED